MKYPHLRQTPIKETIFSVSYEEIVDATCFEKFLKLELVRNKFRDIKPSIDQQFKIKDQGVEISSNENGFHLKNENEVIQIRKGSFSLHYLNGYIKFSDILNELIKYKSDKMPVGKGERTGSFTMHSIQVKKNDVLYLYTDGYADQFGGEKGKKFKYKPLNQLLASISTFPGSEQKEIIRNKFTDWKGPLEQVDDVLVVGIRL